MFEEAHISIVLCNLESVTGVIADRDRYENCDGVSGGSGRQCQWGVGRNGLLLPCILTVTQVRSARKAGFAEHDLKQTPATHDNERNLGVALIAKVMMPGSQRGTCDGPPNRSIHARTGTRPKGCPRARFRITPVHQIDKETQVARRLLVLNSDLTGSVTSEFALVLHRLAQRHRCGAVREAPGSAASP